METAQFLPRWWGKDHNSAWNRIKPAVRRDWSRTNHDFGGEAGQSPIAPSSLPSYEEAEYAYRFGYGARMEFGEEDWDDEIADRLMEEWERLDPGDPLSWERNRRIVRAGWQRWRSEERE